jgi:hypothetical protein
MLGEPFLRRHLERGFNQRHVNPGLIRRAPRRTGISRPGVLAVHLCQGGFVDHKNPFARSEPEVNGLLISASILPWLGLWIKSQANRSQRPPSTSVRQSGLGDNCSVARAFPESPKLKPLSRTELATLSQCRRDAASVRQGPSRTGAFGTASCEAPQASHRRRTVRTVWWAQESHRSPSSPIIITCPTTGKE